MMQRDNLKAGKKYAQEHAPDPIENQPEEAPIISEEEAQVIESPEDAEKPDQDEGLLDKILGDDDDDESSVPENGVRIRPRHQD